MKSITRFRIWGGIAVALVVAFALLGSVPTSSAAFPGVNGRIAFESTQAGNAEVFVMNSDGTGVTNISQHPAADGEPVWSPDGSKIVFVSFRDGNSEIYTMNADGTGATRLTNEPAVDEIPAWSPDGSQIIFYSQRDGHDQIYVMNADGTNQTNLSNNASNDAFGRFSPDGTIIVFQSASKLYRMDADGSNRTQLTSGPDGSPAWSPDGSKIAFHRCSGFCKIYVMNADSTGQTQLTSSNSDTNPVWSPDGSKIAFDSTRTGNYEVFVMDADGNNQTNITNNAAVDFRPDWGTNGGNPTSTPTATLTQTLTDSPTDTPTLTPTDTPTNTPTDTPTLTPTNTPTDTPTNTPTEIPTDTPTNTPTEVPPTLCDTITLPTPDSVGEVIVVSDCSVLTLDVTDGLPPDWNQISYDDSGWDTAVGTPCDAYSSWNPPYPNSLWIWHHYCDQIHQYVAFRKTFTLPAGPYSGQIRIHADDSSDVHINGTSVGSNSQWSTEYVYDLTPYLVTGDNVIAIFSTNTTSVGGGGGPAGITFRAEFTLPNTPTATATDVPTNTPTATPTDTPTNTPTATPAVAHMRVAAGSYVGDGTDNRSITGVGFAPDLVFIKGNLGQPAIVRSATMSNGLSKALNGGGALTNRIESLDGDGFTIGTDADVNKGSPAKTYYWIAFKAAAGEMVLGTYTGNHTGQTISGVGFQPDYVLAIAGDTGQGWQRSSATAGVKSFNYGNADSNTAITSLASDGFTVGTDDQVNENVKTFHYIAWKIRSGSMNTGTYAGNSTDNRDITDVGFQPDWVIVKNTSGTSELTVHHPLSLGASNNDTMQFNADANLGAGYIKALLSQGFRLGTKPQVNGGTQCSGPCNYFWVAFKDGGN